VTMVPLNLIEFAWCQRGGCWRGLALVAGHGRSGWEAGPDEMADVSFLGVRLKRLNRLRFSVARPSFE